MEDDLKLTSDDWEHLFEIMEGMDSIESISETVMTSIGYVELWNDGDVIGFGRNFGNVYDYA